MRAVEKFTLKVTSLAEVLTDKLIADEMTGHEAEEFGSDMLAEFFFQLNKSPEVDFDIEAQEVIIEYVSDYFEWLVNDCQEHAFSWSVIEDKRRELQEYIEHLSNKEEREDEFAKMMRILSYMG